MTRTMTRNLTTARKASVAPDVAAAVPAPADGIDLTAAEKVVGINSERRAWLAEMLTSDGMSPGSSSRAHARAFRFAGSLERAGYIVAEGPYGPRRGRRFIITGYGGPLLGLVRTLHNEASCDHDRVVCGCFDGLTIDDLRIVRRVTRKLSKGCGHLLSTDAVAALVRSYGGDVVQAAAAVYLQAKERCPFTAGYGQIATGDRGLAALVELTATHDGRTLAEAVDLTAALLAGRGVNYDGHPDLRRTLAALVAAES